MIAMFIADHAVHAAGGEHYSVDILFWHFHGPASLSSYFFFYSTTFKISMHMKE
jgi:hypothetical protein